MAVYDGVPSIRLEGDEERALALIPEGKVLLQTVQRFRQNAGVSTFSMTQKIGFDSTIYVLSAYDNHIIYISVDPDVPEQINLEESVPYELVIRPDFYSGVVFDGGFIEERTRVEDDGTKTEYKVCRRFSPTPTCVRMHEKDLVSGRQEVERLAVEPWAAFEDQRNKTPPPTFSQYTKLRSSMYSGKMKQVVQLVMGLGRITKPKLRDPDRPLGEKDSKYITDVSTKGVQVRYDWRFIRTHGITRGADGRLWLVEISTSRGVIARLLPIFPGSRFEGFRETFVRLNDSAMVTALDELGCLPTGEAFPSGKEYDTLREKGEIRQLMSAADLAPFYSCSSYSSYMGWAFNESGTEAHNTGYYFGEDGFQRGVWYQINIYIGHVAPNGVDRPLLVNAYANLRKNFEGYIWCFPGPSQSYARYVPMKFYEPMLPGLLSHEGVPTVEAAGLPIPRVDTPMFVSFINNELHVVRFFRSNDVAKARIEDDSPEDGCKYAGAWTRTETTDAYMPPMMYSNIYDPRELLEPLVTVQEWESADLGWQPPGSIFTDRLNSSTYRSRRFKQTYRSYNFGWSGQASAAAVPQYSREAYYMVYAKSKTEGTKYVSVSYDHLADVTSYRGTNNGTVQSIPPGPGQTYCVGADPPIDNPYSLIDYVVIREVSQNPGPCRFNYANDGPWMQCHETYHVMMSPPPAPATTQVFTQPPPPVETAEGFLFSPGHNGPVTIPITFSAVANHWMTPSPDPVTDIVQNIYAEHSAIGQDMLVYATNLSSYEGLKLTRGYTPDVIGPNDGYPTFVGVNSP